jgi:hypothetical protein
MIALFYVTFASTPVSAQKPAPIPPNPQAPTLAVPTPTGAQPGTAVELNLTGTNLADPATLWTNIPGARVTIPTDNNNGKDATKVRVKLEIPKEVPIGYYGIRLATKHGISNLRLFCIDDLLQVIETTGNQTKAMAQAVPVPCVVLGRADAEASDFFKFPAKAGQRISFDVIGHRLGSAFDPQITLYDAKTERELPGGHSNDAPGLQTDARLTYTFKDAGDYLIEVRDVMFRGGPDFVYRVRIGDFPCATTPIPMALKRGSKLPVRFAGTTVDGVAPVEVTAPADPQTSVVWVAPRSAAGLQGWPVPLTLSNIDEVVEQEPNNEPAKANRVPVPGAVTGTIQEKGDIDYFAFTLKKDQRYLIDAHTHEFGSPAEVYMVLKDAAGQDLGRTDPTKAPHLDFTAKADGDVRLHVEHLHHSIWGGPTETYRISIVPFEPTFDLSVGIDRYDVPQGGLSVAIVNAARNGYDGPIEVNVLGHPGVTGQAVIPPGQASVILPLTAKPDVPIGGYSITIQGKAMINNKAVTRDASVKGVLVTALGGLLNPPAQFGHQIGLGVTDKPPFTLAFKFDQPEHLRGGTVAVTITAVRGPGFVEDIALAPPVGLPPNVAPAMKNIAKNTNEIKVELKPAPNAPLGSFPIAFVGRAKFQGKDYAATAAPAPLVLALPFDLTTEPKPLTLMPGGKVKVKVNAVRKAGYQGPIAVELRNLPANVTAPKATIAMGQAFVEIEITAAANAAPASKADVNVLGTATAAANQQNASPNFTVEIKK